MDLFRRSVLPTLNVQDKACSMKIGIVIAAGGDLVLDTIKKGSSFADDHLDIENCKPWSGDRAKNYILGSSGRPIEDFLNGRLR